MDEVSGDGSAELLDHGSIEIEFAYHNGDEAVLKAKRELLQQPALMFAVKGFDQASVFWFSPGAVLLDDVHGRGQS